MSRRWLILGAFCIALPLAAGAGVWVGMQHGPAVESALHELTGIRIAVPALAQVNDAPTVPPGAGATGGQAGKTQTANAPTEAPDGKGKILYYRHPMGLPEISYEPKKDSMGMDYIPVYENEAAGSADTVQVSLDKVQKLGVRTEPAMLRDVMRTVRAVGTVQLDERSMATVTTKFEGWIEKLHVNTTGQPVQRGQPLMEVYSPDLVVAQQEYLIAWNTLLRLQGASAESRASAQRFVDAALQRLRNWDISESQLERLRVQGTASRRLTIFSPAGGHVMEKMVVQGMRVMPGEPLYEIADLSTVWLVADVFEQDLGLIHIGETVRMSVNAYPGETFTGTVSFIYPAIAAETRTAKVRIEIPNPNDRLKPDMYATLEIAAPVGATQVVSVPESAVLDSGTRQAVLIERGEGRYEPRLVKLGARADGVVEVREGLSAGEKVVVSANFLIDAESNLQAALRAFVADAPAPNGDSSGTGAAAPATTN
jgi:membrane fusion protein, copper/silver efflux system